MPSEAAGERLDRHIVQVLDETRNRVQHWIRNGRVELDGAPAKPSTVLAGGEWLVCAPPAPEDDRAPQPEPGELCVIHEDADVIVLDKPPGLSVHPGAGRSGGTLVNRLLARYPEIASVGSPARPGIVHRLDLGTSGVMVVARNVAAYRHLSACFQERLVGKKYLAVVYGNPPVTGEVTTAIGRHTTERKRMTVRADGRPAHTRYRVLARHAAGLAVLDLAIATGRTHQIRVHLKSIGYPLVGDPVYGEARFRSLPATLRAPLSGFPRPALHAWQLEFRHPSSGLEARFEAPVPPDLVELWQALGGQAFPAPSARAAQERGSE